MNVDDLFRTTVRRNPAQPAILAEAGKQTYAELDRAIQAASEQLRGAGITAGTSVAVHYPSGHQYIVWTYAVWRCGGCVVPVPVELVKREKQQVCQEIRIDYLLGREPSSLKFAEPLAEGSSIELSPDACLQKINSPREHPVGFADVNAAFIRFTSGTTGDSKGVVLSHESIRDRIYAANTALSINDKDRVIWMLSMSYHFTVSIVGYLTFGASIILPTNHFATAVYSAARDFDATIIYGSPMHYALLADFEEGQPVPSLRLVISTAAALEDRFAEKFRDRYHLPITQALGIIEVGLPCINTQFAATQPQAVGNVLPAFEMQLTDVGLGEQIGEVQFRGPGFLDAYYDPWKIREDLLHNGWFHTGDIGQIDDAGCVTLCGRSKDVINVMGMKFFPREVESVLISHAHVRDACVFAQAHPRLGEVPVARVQLRPKVEATDLEAELRKFCRERLADYKVPEMIEIVDRLPRTASGKVLHREVGGERQ